MKIMVLQGQTECTELPSVGSSEKGSKHFPMNKQGSVSTFAKVSVFDSLCWMNGGTAVCISEESTITFFLEQEI